MPDREDSSALVPGSAEEVLERMTDGFMRLDAAWRITYVNAAAEKTNNATREGLLGRVFWDAFPAVRGTEVELNLRRAMSERVAIRAEHFYEPYGRWFEMDIHPLADGALAFFGRDFTARRVDEEERQRLYGMVARKAAELAHSESQLAEAQQLAHVGSWNWDLATDLLTWSDEHYRICGLERQDGPMTLERGLSVIHPDDLPKVRRMIDEALRERTSYECSLRLVRPDGSIRFVHSRGRTVVDPAGEPVRMYGTLQDVTERVRAEEARAVLAAIVESSDDAIVSKDLDGTISSWNDGARRIFGYDAGEVIGLPISVLIPAELAAQEPYILARLRCGERIEHFETVRVAKGGRRVDVSLTISPIRDADGRVVGASKVARDITDRKRAEEALRVAKEQLDLAMRASNLGIWDLDLPGGGEYRVGPVRFVNVWEQLGYDPAEFPMDASASRALGHPDDLTAVDAAVNACLAGESEEIRVENRIRHKDGSYHWLLTLGKAMRDASAKPVRLIGTVLDITERKRHEAEIQSAREAAEAASRSKDDFLAVVSHELRTPLGAILLWSEMLAAGTVNPEKYPEAFGAIRQSAVAQHQLIEDLLDVSRLLSGEFRLNAMDIALAPVIRAAVDTVRPSAEAKGIEVAMSLDERAGLVTADSHRIQQVMWNLLTNAVKFTGSGGRVTVALRQVRDVVQVAVADTGAGIDPQFLPHVFERFRQADSSTTRAHAGLGLGLSIARQLVELHGGTISAQSAGEGKGATFTVELPVVRAWSRRETDAPAAGSAEEVLFVPSPLLRGARILLVEDEAHTRTVVQWLLERCEAEVTAVASAAEALDAFRAAVRGRRYNALISDVGMPGQDGYELIRQVRALERETDEATPIPAIALTAYAAGEDRAKALKSGFFSHVSKPVRAAAFVRIVAESMGRLIDET